MLLASSGSSYNLFNVDDFSTHQTFPLNSEDCITSVSWSKDGKNFAALDKKNLLLYAVSSKSAICSDVISHFVKPSCMKFASTLSHYIAIGVNDREVWVWDFKSKTKRKKFTLPGHVSSVSKIAFNNTDSHLIAGTSDGFGVLLSNVNNLINSPVKLFTSRGATTDIDFSLKNRFLIGACSDQGSISFMDTKSNTVVKCLDKAHSAPVSGLAFSPVNDLLMASVGYDKKFNSYNVNTKREVMNHQSSSPLSSICFLPNGQQVALGSMRGEILVHDLRNIIKPIFTIQASHSPIYSMRMQPIDSKLDHSVKKSTNANKRAEQRPSLGSHQKTTYDKSLSKSTPVPSQRINSDSASLVKTIKYVETTPPRQRTFEETEDLEILSPLNKENNSPYNTGPSQKDISPKKSTTSDSFLSPIKNDSLPEVSGSGGLLKEKNQVHDISQELSTRRKLLSEFANSVENLNTLNGLKQDESYSHVFDSLKKSPKISTASSPIFKDQPEEQFSLPRSLKLSLKPPTQKDTFQPGSNKESVESQASNDLGAHKCHCPITDGEIPSNGAGNVNVELIRNCISDELYKMQSDINERFVNMQWNMIKYHLQLKNEIIQSIQEHSLNEELMEENLMLREEIKRLKSNF